MPDREKVIEYLNSEIYRAKQSVNDIWLECVEVKLLRDALELLKPVEVEMEGGGSMWYPVCGECHGYINDTWKFCPECGRKVKWNG